MMLMWGGGACLACLTHATPRDTFSFLLFLRTYIFSRMCLMMCPLTVCKTHFLSLRACWGADVKRGSELRGAAAVRGHGDHATRRRRSLLRTGVVSR